MLSRLARRIRLFTFPATCGLKAIRMEDLIAGHGDVTFRVARWDKDIAAGSFWDACAVALLSHVIQPKLAIEFGTGHGRGSAQIAANSSPEAIIITVDISDHAEKGSVFRELPEASKIRQHVADTTTFDFSRWFGQADLVLVDGSHEYDVVVKDTKTAFKLVSPKGVILWHDVTPDWPGVVRALRESPDRESIRRLVGTNYAVFAGAELRSGSS